MQDAPDTLSICWCAAVAGEGAPARARELASFAHVVVVDPGSLDASALDGADIVVLDLDAFEGIHALVAAAARIDAPVLVRASADRIDGVLAELRTRDEASLDTDPASLLAHRLRRMHEAAAHQRDPLTGAATRVVFTRASSAPSLIAAGLRPCRS